MDKLKLVIGEKSRNVYLLKLVIGEKSRNVYFNSLPSNKKKTTKPN